MAVDLVVSGSRPGTGSPKTARARYRVRSEASFVEETLFGDPSGRPLPYVRPFEAPWAGSPRPTSAPSTVPSTPKTPSGSGMPMTRNKYRLVKHSPTYCDEMLFGGPLADSGWDPPWVSREERGVRIKPLLWTPPSYRPHRAESEHKKNSPPLKAPHRMAPLETAPIDGRPNLGSATASTNGRGAGSGSSHKSNQPGKEKHHRTVSLGAHGVAGDLVVCGSRPSSARGDFARPRLDGRRESAASQTEVVRPGSARRPQSARLYGSTGSLVAVRPPWR
ncbi:RBPJ-interacting and tubulin-associated protein 1 [Lethenteron reissneri]|uniref:RBPJ-interacting and tubulin-associated protein 1 n=1 Tax=Lethenteron reissneri TaxID=7753 RepID=UPI002AB6BF32|nr:RBPJ-interacting and tubulin-associated protein 1 [Lethenteron reissneri]